MNCNEAMNKSIRVSSWLVKAFPFVSDRFIDTAQWSDYDDLYYDLSETALKHAGNTINLGASSDELRYIHENLAPEAFAKLGLKLPTTNEYEECMDCGGNGICNDTPDKCTRPHKQSKKLPEKRLEYTIPQLSAEEIEVIKKMIPLYMENKPACTHAYLNLICSACPIPAIRKSISDFKCMNIPNKQIGQNLQKVLDAQLPPLKYNVPVLNEKEQEVVSTISTYLKTSCYSIACSHCHPIIAKIFGEETCCFALGRKWTPISDPKRAQIIDVLKDVLKQQEPLLPPHNVVQFAEPYYTNWVRWLNGPDNEGICPWTDKPIVAGALCEEQCICVFPEIEGRFGVCPKDLKQYGSKVLTQVLSVKPDCPCLHYSPAITRTIIEKCVARGPEFETFSVWDAKGRRIRITSQSGSRFYIEPFTWIEEADIGEGKFYTKTPPPPKEKFEPYVAVRVNGDRVGDAFMVIGSTTATEGLKTSEPKSSPWHDQWGGYLCEITNPRECRDMLGEVLGEEDIVEEIKKWCEEYKEHFKVQSGEFCRGKADVYELIYNKITHLQKEHAKCQTSQKKHGKL